MGFWSRLKGLDIYRDIPKDLTEQTPVGALVSIVCLIITFYLFASELMMFWRLEVTSELFVDSTQDTGNQHAMIQINMNISIPKLPCAIVSVDAQDVMGAHVVDVGGELHKLRLDGEGNPKLDAYGRPQPTNYESPLEQMGEGCRVYGNMIVKKVPGNFHVSAHAHANYIHLFFPNTPMNVSHTVHDLSFGEETPLLTAMSGADAHLNPLRGVGKSAAVIEGDDVGLSYEYFLTIVPTQFLKLNGEFYNSYQFVANSNEITGRYRVPAIYFRYDLSAITVRFTEKRKSFAHFLVQICAIIGGVFTVLGLVNSFLHSTLRTVLKKAEMGKLG
jgi:hypothetical protein